MCIGLTREERLQKVEKVEEIINSAFINSLPHNLYDCIRFLERQYNSIPEENRSSANINITSKIEGIDDEIEGIDDGDLDVSVMYTITYDRDMTDKERKDFYREEKFKIGREDRKRKARIAELTRELNSLL